MSKKDDADRELAAQLLLATERGGAELEALGAPKAGLAVQLLGRTAAALGHHTPGWSGSLASPLTKRALSGLH